MSSNNSQNQPERKPSSNDSEIKKIGDNDHNNANVEKIDNQCTSTNTVVEGGKDSKKSISAFERARTFATYL